MKTWSNQLKNNWRGQSLTSCFYLHRSAMVEKSKSEEIEIEKLSTNYKKDGKPMGLVNFFAMVGMTINDIISIYSVIGSFMLFVGAFAKSSNRSFNQFADWSILGLIFGGLSQIAMAVTNSTPEKIGILLPMSAWMVNGLLLSSLLLLFSGWWTKRSRR